MPNFVVLVHMEANKGLAEINLMTTFHVIASEKAVASKADEFLLFLLQISEDMYVESILLTFARFCIFSW